VNQFAQPHPRCRTCALPLPIGMRQCGACLKNPPPLDLCLTAVPYAFPWSGLIADFKFHDQLGLKRSFATLLRSAPWVEPELETARWLIPMPLSPDKLKERGYNQAAVLARELDSTKTNTQLLHKIKNTPAQHTLPRQERLAALVDAFAVDPLLAPSLKGQRVVLVDDVMTTGASLTHAARALKAAGASQVCGLVLARTE